MSAVSQVSLGMPAYGARQVRAWCWAAVLAVSVACLAVDNGGFEQWLSTGPQGWFRTPGTLPVGAVGLSSGAVPEGWFALRLSTAYPTTRNTGLFQDVSVDAGVSYEVSAWVRILQNPLRRDVGLGIRPGGGGMYNVALTGGNHGTLSEPGGWQRIRISTQVPAGTATLGISVFVRIGGTDTPTVAEFDDVRVVRDAMAPAAVTDLEATATGAGVALAWTAPGDDGTAGVLLPGSVFLVACSSVGPPGEQPGDSDGLPVVLSAAGVVPGARQTALMEHLSPDVTWYVRLWTRDNSGNVSECSNVADTAGYGAPDGIPPAGVTDLRVVAWDASGRVVLAWTAPGDDGTVGTIEGGTVYVRTSSGATSGIVWSTMTAQIALSTGGILPGTTTQFTVALHPNTTWWIALWYRDVAGNVSEMSNLTSVFVEPPSAVTVRFSEINYDDDIGDAGYEWVEVANRSSHPLDMTRWRVRSSGMGTGRPIAPEPGWGDIRVLPPSAVAVICEAAGGAGDFAVRFGPPSPERYLGRIAGDWALSNNGGWVRLMDEWDRVIAEARYAGTVANRSVVPIAEDADAADTASWAAGAPGGTPFVADLAVPPSAGDAAWPGAVVINEFLYDAPGADGGWEWIELVSCATRSFVLNGWRVQKTTGPALAGAVWTDVVVATGGNLGAGGWWLCAQSSAAASFGADLVIPDGRTLNNTGPCALRLLDARGQELDRVAYGGTVSDELAEGGRAAGSCARDAGESLVRRPQGYDTDDNAADWVVGRSPTPRSARWTDTELPQPSRSISAIPGHRTISVAWDWGDSDDVRQAEVSVVAAEWSAAAVRSYPATTWRVEPVANRRVHEVSVVLVDRCGNRSLPRTTSCEPSIAPPAHLSADWGMHGVSLRWTHSPDAGAPECAGYRIYRALADSDGGFQFIAQTAGTSWEDPVPRAEGPLLYRICTVEDVGTESAAAATCVASPDVLPPVFVSVVPIVRGGTIHFILRVRDDRWAVGDGAGRLADVRGWWRVPGGATAFPLLFAPSFEPGSSLFDGAAVVGDAAVRSVEVRFESSDGVRAAHWPSNGWFPWVPIGAPVRTVVTPHRPEVVFGAEVRSVEIRDAAGRLVWRAQRTAGDALIVWRACDRSGVRVEAGAYRSVCVLDDGRRVPGIVVVLR